MIKISVIIISRDGNRDGNVALLMKDIRAQSESNIEIVLVKGVSPVGKARNTGLRKAKGEFIVFLDDDIRLPNHDVIKELLDGIQKYPNDLVGGGHIIPLRSNRLQRWLARDIPREQIIPRKDRDEDSDRIATCCWASKAQLYSEVGLFNEDITAGEDTDFRKRVRRTGRRTIMLKGLVVYHPAKESFWVFLNQFFWYGKGIGELHRSKASGTVNIFFKTMMPVYILFRMIMFPLQIFFPGAHRMRIKSILAPPFFRPLYAIGLLSYYIGFACG